MLIDIRSIMVSGAILNVFFLFLSVFTWKRGRNRVRGPGFWLIGFFCFMLGFVLVALRDIIPDCLSIIAGNGIIMAGIMFKLIGFTRYMSVRSIALEAILAAGLVLYIFAMYVSLSIFPSLQMRMFINSFFNSILGSIVVIILSRFRAPCSSSHISMTKFFFAAFTLLYAIRAVRALVWQSGNNWIDSGDIIESWLMVFVLSILGGIAVGEMLLLHGHLEASLKAGADELGQSNQRLLEEISRRVKAEQELLLINKELGSTQKEIMITLAEVVEFRSKETALHVARVAEYVRILAAAAGKPAEEVKLLADAAPMHDIGKIAIPDDILTKPQGLSAVELDLVRSHTTVGYGLLNKSDRPLIRLAALIALEHHEHWDGGGYPYGKSGEDISFAGRVVCLCDVYDALAVARPYKDAWELPRILEYIRGQSGSMFDPALVEAFFLNIDNFLKISAKLAEPPVPAFTAASGR